MVRFFGHQNEVVEIFDPKTFDFSVKKRSPFLRLLHEKNNETAVVTAIDLWLGETPSGVCEAATRGWVYTVKVGGAFHEVVLGTWRMGPPASLGIYVVLLKGVKKTIPPFASLGNVRPPVPQIRYSIHPSWIEENFGEFPGFEACDFLGPNLRVFLWIL